MYGRRYAVTATALFEGQYADPSRHIANKIPAIFRARATTAMNLPRHAAS
jgi:hypothetical protein